jgi:hypothetical protein
MEGIIDFHTHAFPDDLSGRVIKMLEDEGGVKAQLDGRISSLLSSMDACGSKKASSATLRRSRRSLTLICNFAGQPDLKESSPFLHSIPMTRSLRSG